MSYLILHKVRGEPAFDIADKLQIGDEEGWIIPTSGHRAYPYWYGTLSEFHEHLLADKSLIPSDLPDHYEIDKGSKPSPSFNIMTIISPMMTRIKRRL
jgi:hypothetical protein